MYKACSKCGKIHPVGVKCSVGRTYNGGSERRMRSSWAWNKKSREIRERAQHLCEVCRDQGRYTYEGLEVHHIEKVTERPDLFMEDTNLICLCVEHHKQAEESQKELTKEYLRSLAYKREGWTPPVG